MKIYKHNKHITNILVIGCGGAGLRAAIEVKKCGLNVQIMGNGQEMILPVLAAGGINASFGNLDKMIRGNNTS